MFFFNSLSSHCCLFAVCFSWNWLCWWLAAWTEKGSPKPNITWKREGPTANHPAGMLFLHSSLFLFKSRYVHGHAGYMAPNETVSINKILTASVFVEMATHRFIYIFSDNNTSSSWSSSSSCSLLVFIPYFAGSSFVTLCISCQSVHGVAWINTEQNEVDT